MSGWVGMHPRGPGLFYPSKTSTVSCYGQSLRAQDAEGFWYWPKRLLHRGPLFGGKVSPDFFSLSFFTNSTFSFGLLFCLIMFFFKKNCQKNIQLLLRFLCSFKLKVNLSLCGKLPLEIIFSQKDHLWKVSKSQKPKKEKKTEKKISLISVR